MLDGTINKAVDFSDHPKCKTCDHFRGVDAQDSPPLFGYCMLIDMTCEMMTWNDERDCLELLPEYKGHLAGVMDGSHYSADLHPHSSFYCPMHSELMPELVGKA